MHDFLRVCICVWNDFWGTKSCLQKIIVCEGLNGIAIINHGFLKLKVLMLIYAAISLVGLHILNPLQNLMLDKNTTYSTLLNSFPKLNEELNLSSPKDISTLKKFWGYSRKWRAYIWFFKRNGKKWQKKCWNRAKNGKKIENLGKNAQYLKVFWKRVSDCVKILHALNCWKRHYQYSNFQSQNPSRMHY